MKKQFVLILLFVSLALSEPLTRNAVAHGSFSPEVIHIIRSTNISPDVKSDSGWLNSSWLPSVNAHFSMHGNLHDAFLIDLGFKAAIRYSYPGLHGDDSPLTGGYFGLEFAYTTFLLRNPEHRLGKISLGYFPFSFAPQARILGDYLFKTGTYPGFIISGEEPAKVAGILTSLQLPKYFSFDLLWTLEYRYPPVNDVSLTNLVHFQDTKEFFKTSVGIMFDRLFPNDHSLTYNQRSDDILKTGYINKDGDTIFYTKAGIKLTGSILFDIKKILSTTIFGENELQFYAEAAILGTKNYPGYYYPYLWQRIPVMVGFNFPTMRLLDVLSFEIEWYGSPYYNNPYNSPATAPVIDFDYTSLPYEGTNPADSVNSRGTTDNLKWALYTEKSFFDFLTFSFLIAGDHFRVPVGWLGGPRELLHAPNEWYWKFGLSFNF